MTEPTRVTPEDVDAVAEKLAKFAEQLPQQERNILGWIIARASAASEQDVSGYLSGLGTTAPTPTLQTGLFSGSALSPALRTAAGLGALRPGLGSAASISVSWGW
jgi:hypothetical protein